MSDLRKAAEMALEALQYTFDYLPAKSGVERDVDYAITALRQALAEPELQQRTGDCLLTGSCAAEGHKIYTAPPKREWVGLTEDEVTDCFLDSSEKGILIEEAIEAKLKEKNA